MPSSHLANRQVPVTQDISPHVDEDMATNSDCPQNQWGEKNGGVGMGGSRFKSAGWEPGNQEVELKGSEVRGQRPGE